MNNFIKGGYRIRLFPKRQYEQNLEAIGLLGKL